MIEKMVQTAKQAVKAMVLVHKARPAPGACRSLATSTMSAPPSGGASILIEVLPRPRGCRRDGRIGLTQVNIAPVPAPANRGTRRPQARASDSSNRAIEKHMVLSHLRLRF
jgi:hypothetical protein